MSETLFGTSHRASIWLCTDSCGLTCAVVTWSLHIFAWSTVTKLVLGPWLGSSLWGLTHLTLYTCLTVLSLASHGTAMFTNPGAVPQDAQPLPADAALLEAKGGWRKRRFCGRCKAFKPARAHHDSVTGRCVVKLDHYCPWVNNAVGIFNHKFFLLFVFYTFLQCGYSLVLVVARFLLCASDGDGPGCEQLGVLTALVLLEAVLFGLFTMCMLCDQCSVLTTNETKIDRLKGEKHLMPTAVNEVFGSASSKGLCCTWLKWLLPFPVTFPESIKGQVLGFELPSRFTLASAGTATEDCADVMERDIEMGALGNGNGSSDAQIDVFPSEVIDPTAGPVDGVDVEVVEILKETVVEEEAGLLLRTKAATATQTRSARVV